MWVFRSRAQRESRVHPSAAPLSSTLHQPASENRKKAVLLLAVGGKLCAKIKKKTTNSTEIAAVDIQSAVVVSDVTDFIRTEKTGMGMQSLSVFQLVAVGAE